MWLSLEATVATRFSHCVRYWEQKAWCRLCYKDPETAEESAEAVQEKTFSNRSQGGENSRNSCLGCPFFKTSLLPHPGRPTPLPPLWPPREGPPVTTGQTHPLISSTLSLSLSRPQQMPVIPPGPTLPALVVLGHLVSLIVFWSLRKPKRQGKMKWFNNVRLNESEGRQGDRWLHLFLCLLFDLLILLVTLFLSVAKDNTM